MNYWSKFSCKASLLLSDIFGLVSQRMMASIQSAMADADLKKTNWDSIIVSVVLSAWDILSENN